MMKLKSCLLVGFVALCMVAYVGGAMAEEGEKTKPSQVQADDIPLPSANELYQVSKEDMVLGNADAKVTIIEYASMTCSHCADFHQNTYPEVKEKYIDTGKAKLVFRPFPLDEVALRASMLAYCAGPEKFYKFTDVLFTTQKNWAFGKNHLEVLSNIGKLGGLSGEKFDQCLADAELEKRILHGKFYAAKVLGVRATPSFFINGVAYKGSHNFKEMQEMLDEALAEKAPQPVAKE